MYIYEVKMRAFEPKDVTIKIECHQPIDSEEFEAIAEDELYEQFPNLEDPIIMDFKLTELQV